MAIITRDAGRRLGQCLGALGFADAIVVLDSGSRDQTLEIARGAGAQVLVNEDWRGFGVQKNRAIDALQTDWILVVDADEVVSPELASSLRDAMASAASEVYALDRMSSFCGMWIRHSGWYPDPVARLFRRGSARFSDDLVHERLLYSGSAPVLRGKLWHYSYDDFETVLRKLDDYSSAGARQRAMADKGRGASAPAGLARALRRGAWAFLRTYLLRGGILDGRAGFMIAVFNAQTVYYRFLKLGLLQRARPPVDDHMNQA